MAIDQQPRLAKRVLLIGWDAADWQMIRPLMDQGLMPTLQAMIERGAWGNLATMRPVLSPMLWNSIATGKRPEKHGILGFAEVTPDGQAVRPAASTSRKCKALWNILTQQGMTSNVVGWYASHPAEPISGVMVSNQFEQARGSVGDDWPVPPGSVHPQEMADALAELRVHPGELDAGAILPFVPKLRDPRPSEDPLLAKLMELLAQTVSIHTVATKLLADEPADFTAVYYEGIDRFGHEFMHLHPPQRDGVDPQQFKIYSGVMNAIYRFHDMMLQTLLELAGDDTAVILVSDHGYYSRDDRPAMDAEVGPTDWHRDYGIVVLAGPPFQQGEQLFGAGLLDIAPTVLRLLGLPVGEDMDGRPWAEALTETIEPHRIGSWDEVDGDSGTHPPVEEDGADPIENLAALQQLAELGYIEPIGDNIEEAIRRTVADQAMNLASSYIHAGNPGLAVPELERVLEIKPNHPGVQMQLALCLAQVGQVDRARGLIEPLAQAETNKPRARLMLGTLEAEAGRLEQAREHFQAVEAADARLPGLHLRLGNVCARLGLWEEAERAYQKAIEISPDSPGAYKGLCDAAAARGDAPAAIGAGLRAVELAYFFPTAHLALGRAFKLDDRTEQAKEAFSVAVRQAPRLVDAAWELGEIHREAAEHQEAARAYGHCLGHRPDHEEAREALAQLFEGPLAQPLRAQQLRQQGESVRIAQSLRKH